MFNIQLKFIKVSVKNQIKLKKYFVILNNSCIFALKINKE